MPTKKLYYFPNQAPLCGICLYIMSPDIVWNNRETSLDKPTTAKFYCTNFKCSQFEQRVTIKPIEVEVEE